MFFLEVDVLKNMQNFFLVEIFETKLKEQSKKNGVIV
jgi:hypothetical protein